MHLKEIRKWKVFTTSSYACWTTNCPQEFQAEVEPTLRIYSIQAHPSGQSPKEPTLLQCTEISLQYSNEYLGLWLMCLYKY